MTWERISGWSDDIIPWAAHIAPRLPRGARYVEIGVFLGRSLAHMGTIRPDLELWAIDPWLGEPGQGWLGDSEHAAYIAPYGSLWRAFLGGMREHAPEVLDRTHVVRSLSSAVEIEPGKADLVFIDGAHDAESVRSDIHSARRWLKKGGIIAGHDYDRDNKNNDFRGLCSVVDEMCPGRKIGLGDGQWSSVWWVET